ncbi:hypothetical protein [Streptomyces sp. NPDC059215]|uniref:hypothetical protein n=1 Tax=Streptomyces sp. NPDC059215 TaxID=3346772 RepID=UPI00369B71E5
MVERTQLTARTEPLKEPAIVSGAERLRAAGHWLLGAAPDLAQSRFEWGEGDVTFLRCGGLFTAISMRRAIVHAAADSASPRLVDGFLEEAFDGGPVIAAYGLDPYYALVPASTAFRWAEPGAQCLPSRQLLTVPPVDRSTYENRASYWPVPMRPGALLASLTLRRWWSPSSSPTR